MISRYNMSCSAIDDVTWRQASKHEKNIPEGEEKTTDQACKAQSRKNYNNTNATLHGYGCALWDEEYFRTARQDFQDHPEQQWKGPTCESETAHLFGEGSAIDGWIIFIGGERFCERFIGITSMFTLGYYVYKLLAVVMRAAQAYKLRLESTQLITMMVARKQDSTGRDMKWRSEVVPTCQLHLYCDVRKSSYIDRVQEDMLLWYFIRMYMLRSDDENLLAHSIGFAWVFAVTVVVNIVEIGAFWNHQNMHIHFFYVLGAFMGIVMFAVVLFILNQAALANIKQAGHMAILSEKRVLFEHQQMELQRLLREFTEKSEKERKGGEGDGRGDGAGLTELQKEWLQKIENKGGHVLKGAREDLTGNLEFMKCAMKSDLSTWEFASEGVIAELMKDKKDFVNFHQKAMNSRIQNIQTTVAILKSIIDQIQTEGTYGKIVAFRLFYIYLANATRLARSNRHHQVFSDHNHASANRPTLYPHIPFLHISLH